MSQEKVIKVELLTPYEVLYNNLKSEGRERVNRILFALIKNQAIFALNNYNNGVKDVKFNGEIVGSKNGISIDDLYKISNNVDGFLDNWLNKNFKNIEVKENFEKLFAKVYEEVKKQLKKDLALKNGKKEKDIDTNSYEFIKELQKRMNKITTGIFYFLKLLSILSNKPSTSSFTSIYSKSSNWKKVVDMPDFRDGKYLTVFKKLLSFLKTNNINPSSITSILSNNEIPKNIFNFYVQINKLYTWCQNKCDFKSICSKLHGQGANFNAQLIIKELEQLYI